MSMIPPWFARGDWFDACSCDIPCPCEFAQPPTNNHCEGVLAYRLNDGKYGEVDLHGLSTVIVAVFDGNIWAGEAELELGLLIDERADAQQREALVDIFTGNAGGVPAGMAAFVKDVRGIDYAPIDFEVTEDLASWRVTIPGKVDARVEALSGPTTPQGARVQLLNPPGSEVGPGGVATWGKVLSNVVDAHGFEWTWSGKSSKHIPFDWSGPG